MLRVMAATTIDDRMQRLVRDFVSQVASVAREAALATLRGQLAEETRSAAPTAPSRSKRTAIAAPRRARARAKIGSKRPTADIARLEALLTHYIAANPGQRVEQVNQALRTTTNAVRLPLARLVRVGTIKTTGTRRATRYFPA